MPLTSSDFEQRPLNILQNSWRYQLNSLKQSTNGFIREVKLIDTISEARSAHQHLKCFNELAIDCEGVRLGRGGKLTLIQVMANNDTIFIFDVLVLGKGAFDHGLKEILESGAVTKYMFDCRGDSDSLWHEYNIKLANVLDTQLFEVMVRPVAGTNLRGPSRPSHFRKLCIRGLDATIKTYVKHYDLTNTGIRSFENVKSNGASLMKSERTVWRYRPVHEGLLNYAALDVEMIWLVKEALVKKINLQGVSLRKLKVASERYLAVRRDHEKPEDLYIRHSIMLSYVFPECIGDVIKPFPIEDTKCDGCRRFLTRSCMKANKCGDCQEIDRASRYK